MIQCETEQTIARSADETDGDVALDLAPIGPDSTRATYRAAMRMRGLWRLLTPLLVMKGKAGQARELQRLKENVETAAAIPIQATAGGTRWPPSR